MEGDEDGGVESRRRKRWQKMEIQSLNMKQDGAM